ncbi:MAG: S8 family peptidase [Cyanobacteria bacterium]|nr:S8 family peptidase [Cyanobacteriota bacterium]
MRVVPPTLVKITALVLWLSVTVSGQTPLATLSGDLLAMLLGGATEDVRAIVRGDVGVIQDVAARDGLPVLRVLDGFVVVQATPAQLSTLRQVAGIASISRDNIVTPLMVISQKTMAADQARASQPGGLLGIGALPGVSGKGVGVAIIDSGINTSHAALAGKVVWSQSFVTGDSSTDDGFGHGTHIAGIVAGQDTGATPLYKGGIAPGAHLINVRVLGDNGGGYTSDVIAGLQWTINNRVKYSIKVVNLSLGHPSVEPCLTDPLCLSVEKAVLSGLVVVASAGNNGKNAAGQEVFASITTPGVAPSAITVGALNTWGTVGRGDDTVTTYSSRGPTRFELSVKPDVVAPGNKIVSLEAQGSYLASKYKELHAAGSGKNAYYTMSGTSMAAGMVSGGAALLLEGGVLTVRQVKLAMQLSASFMANEGVLRAGTGSVNLYSARRVNSAVTALTGKIPGVTIAGQTIQPTGMMTNGGVDRLTAPIGASGLGALELLANWFNIVVPRKLAALQGSQIIWGENSIGQQIIWGEQLPFGQQIIWGENTPWGQQIIWGEQSIGQQIIWGENTFGQQIIWGENSFGQQIIWGEQTAGQQIIWGEADPANANQIIWGENVRPDGQ